MSEHSVLNSQQYVCFRFLTFPSVYFLHLGHRPNIMVCIKRQETGYAPTDYAEQNSMQARTMLRVAISSACTDMLRYGIHEPHATHPIPAANVTGPARFSPMLNGLAFEKTDFQSITTGMSGRKASKKDDQQGENFTERRSRWLIHHKQHI